MTWIVDGIKRIMLVSGALTCSMLYAAIAPQAALRATFGETLEGPLAEIVVRNWGFLITLFGAMLIYGAFKPSARPLILAVAARGKLVFIGLVLAYGRHFLGRQAGLVVTIDSLMIALFAGSLIRIRQVQVSDSGPAPKS